MAGLNPHAGESGLLGTEETTAIELGISLARLRLKQERVAATIVGPVRSETAFRKAKAGDFDGVVAMYHDQATIPMKLVSFGEAVNVMLGLPIVRTSVDHGTAYDIAGSGKADPLGMLAAVDLRDPARAETTRDRKREVTSTVLAALHQGFAHDVSQMVEPDAARRQDGFVELPQVESVAELAPHLVAKLQDDALADLV